MLPTAVQLFKLRPWSSFLISRKCKAGHWDILQNLHITDFHSRTYELAPNGESKATWYAGYIPCGAVRIIWLKSSTDDIKQLREEKKELNGMSFSSTIYLFIYIEQVNA
jgi:hypothetical protein